MAIYCFRTKDGESVDRVFPLGEAPNEIILEDGRPARRDWKAEHVATPSRPGWPMECVASGVNANQAQELRDHLASHGVPTEVTKDGNPIYRDAKHRKRALKARGLHDKLSYY